VESDDCNNACCADFSFSSSSQLVTRVAQTSFFSSSRLAFSDDRFREFLQSDKEEVFFSRQQMYAKLALRDDRSRPFKE
jgi:hypothetical protein